MAEEPRVDQSSTGDNHNNQDRRRALRAIFRDFWHKARPRCKRWGRKSQYFLDWAMWHSRCCLFGVETTTWPRADQDTDLDKEGTEMKATWVPVGSAVAIILLSLGVLEVMSAGVRVDEPGTAARWFSDAPMHSELTPDDLLALDLGPETGETIHFADGYER